MHDPAPFTVALAYTRKQNITRVFVAHGLSGACRPRQITDQRLGTLEGVAQLRQVGDEGGLAKPRAMAAHP